MDTQATTRNAHKFIAELEDFKTYGALEGQRLGEFYFLRLEALTEDVWQGFKAFLDDQSASVKYVVTSYNVPISWYSDTMGWSHNQKRYSVTTSRHQGTARYGASLHSKPLESC